MRWLKRAAGNRKDGRSTVWGKKLILVTFESGEVSVGHGHSKGLMLT